MVKDIIENEKNALYDKVDYNSFNFKNQLNVDSTDTKNEATYTAYREDAKVTLVIGSRNNVIEPFSDEGHQKQEAENIAVNDIFKQVRV